jgi:hypothetical protein
LALVVLLTPYVISIIFSFSCSKFSQSITIFISGNRWFGVLISTFERFPRLNSLILLSYRDFHRLDLR